MQVRAKLAKRAAKLGLALPEAAAGGLEAYFELLQKWNRSISLTALPVDDVTDEAIDRLLVEPALAAGYLPLGDARIMDVGSGGGSPAIPMKLIAPGTSMRMVESKTRKAAFLREAVRHLGLTNTVVEASRFEELLARPELHQSADVVTVRAVRIEQKTMAVLQSFLRPGGFLFLFTSASGRAITPSPQLALHASHMLLPHLATRLDVLMKLT